MRLLELALVVGLVLPGWRLGTAIADSAEAHRLFGPQSRTVVISEERPIDGKLFGAIRKGDVGRVKRLLAAGANARATEANGWPAIVVAAGESLPIVKLLHTKGASINSRQPDQGWTPLTAAINSGRDDVALYAIANGANLELGASDGATPLHFAVASGDIAVVSALLKRHVNVNARTYEDPATAHDPTSVKRVAARFEPGYRQAGQTPLFGAIAQWEGHPDLVPMLIKAGAKLDAVDANGWTLLHHAAITGEPFGVAQLLKLGLSPNARSREGFTPLHVAVRGFVGPSTPAIRELLAAGADRTAKTKQGDTPEELLRSDVARNLGELNQSPTSLGANPQIQFWLRMANEALRALDPKALPITFPDAQVVDGWAEYAPIKLDSFGDQPEGRIDRRVRSTGGTTELSLTLRSQPGRNTDLKLTGLELNTYEPLTAMPLMLRNGVEVVVKFPAPAATLGGAIDLSYDIVAPGVSGGGSVSEPANGISPIITMPGSTHIGVYFAGSPRTLEFRIDSLVVDGKEVTAYRGKVLLVQPVVRAEDLASAPMHGTPLFSLSRRPNRMKLSYSYRFVGNKKWRTNSIGVP